MVIVGGFVVNIMWGFLWLLFLKFWVLIDVLVNIFFVSEVDNVYICMVVKLCYFIFVDGILF